jgi:hypothetical protein
MSAVQTATLYTSNPDTTEETLAKQIKAELEERFDADRPAGEFKVKIEVSRVEKKK